MMDEQWGSGDPKEFLKDLYNAAYDDHRYLKYATDVQPSKETYIQTSCNDNLDSNRPNIVGEWSLSPSSDVENNDDWKPESNKDFYKKWFAAQVSSYEKQQGWIFWTWKAELNDYRWSYKGLLPPDICSLLITNWLGFRCCRDRCDSEEPRRCVEYEGLRMSAI